MIRRLLVASTLLGMGCAGGSMTLLNVPAAETLLSRPGSDAPNPVSLNAYQVGKTEVTNAQFEVFVHACSYKTDAERRGFGMVWDKTWGRMAGATWRSPRGPQSTIERRGDHPVTQVSAHDAEAFCTAYGMQLPTDAQWEFAARGPSRRTYPWGNALPRQDNPPQRANFGTMACCAPSAEDRYLYTAPVGQFPHGRSPFGALDMTGNVWEWTRTSHPDKPEHRIIRGGGWGNNPHCLRIPYRHTNPPDLSLDMVGFRCVAPPGHQLPEAPHCP